MFKISSISLKGEIFSKYLKRNVAFRVVAPPNYRDSNIRFPVLLMNDGQDYGGLQLENTIETYHTCHEHRPFIYIGIETDKNRIHEYGTAVLADFKNRGSRAGLYTKFIIEEFIPFLKGEFKVSYDGLDWFFCGMSLGGLSAFDIVLNHPEYFSKAGVFSGSFWWRKKAYDPNDEEDRSRIVLNMVRDSNYHSHLKFWFECGTLDEKADRNKNGIIDSIDDTKDLITELEKKGYNKPDDITYVEINEGRHDLATWASVFPDFLKWAFG
ncbi:MAG: esterase [Polaribacter sp.]|nr:MAG: esterase [Polaribacter sp.]